MRREMRLWQAHVDAGQDGRRLSLSLLPATSATDATVTAAVSLSLSLLPLVALVELALDGRSVCG